MDKSWRAGDIEEKEVRADEPNRMFFPHWGRSIFWVPEGMVGVEVPQNKEISEGGKNGGEKESVLLSVQKERIGGA